MTQSTQEPETRLRANRILDAAAELLLKHGYKRVTVEDIASQAGVGKGTVYLHWKTKNDVFAMVLLRDAVTLIRTLLDAMRADPQEILLHRISRTSFLEIMRQPLSRALYTGDVEILGALAKSKTPGFHDLQLFGRQIDESYNSVMRSHQLLRGDIDPTSQRYAINATSRGFFFLNHSPFSDEEIGLEAKANALADTIRHAFGPLTPPDQSQLAAAAPSVIALYEDLVAQCVALLPEPSPETGVPR